jgi:phosphoribulokinase
MNHHVQIFRQLVEVYLTAEQSPRRDLYAPGTAQVIAVSGAAASGKTTFCRQLVDYLMAQGVSAVHVPLDGYLLDREARFRRGLSGYDPQASDMPHMVDQMKRLIFHGKAIDLPVYNHLSGTHDPPRRIQSARVVLLDGILSMHHEIRERFPNLKLFFTSEEIVIRGLRLLVDMQERGYTVFQALANSDAEFANYKRWIYPQIGFADLTIHVSKDRKLSIMAP